jgi:hypothetical protein
VYTDVENLYTYFQHKSIRIFNSRLWENDVRLHPEKMYALAWTKTDARITPVAGHTAGLARKNAEASTGWPCARVSSRYRHRSSGRRESAALKGRGAVPGLLATEADLDKEIDKFITSFQGGKGGTKAGSEQFDALPADEVEQAKIVKPRKRK